MKLSIIVPVYKVRRYLQRCIESILQQTYTDYELILVDDGSPDSCGAICDRYAQECDKVRVIHKKNGGLSSARNAGIAAARGEYITFVDGDDAVASGTYYYNMRILQSNPDVDILEYPVHKYYESPRSSIVSFAPEKVSGNEAVFADWVKRKGYEHCFAWNKIYRADLFMFVRYPEGEVFEDTLVTPMLIESSNTVYYSDAGFYYYYDNEDGICNRHSFGSYFYLYRNLAALHEKCAAIPELHEEANRILLRCIDNLTDLCRCSDCEKDKLKEAVELVKERRINIGTLYKIEFSLKQKIKYTTFALFGAGIHCRLLALFHKKLN
ncbi:MAG: glycosyltransferase [Bacteroidaceae bacterium]|nr:glycosyltransferase [Bacteroidaceae bacterium]